MHQELASSSACMESKFTTIYTLKFNNISYNKLVSNVFMCKEINMTWNRNMRHLSPNVMMVKNNGFELYMS